MTTTTSLRVLVDSNVLVYAIDRDSPNHAASRALLERGLSREIDLCTTVQNILEFVTISTNPRRVKTAISMAQAWAEVTHLRQCCRLVHPPVDLLERIQAMVPTVLPRHVELYDLAIAVTGLANDIDTICTYDTAVFARVPGLSVLAP